MWFHNESSNDRIIIYRFWDLHISWPLRGKKGKTSPISVHEWKSFISITKHNIPTQISPTKLYQLVCWKHSFTVKNCGNFNSKYKKKSGHLCCIFFNGCTSTSMFTPWGEEKTENAAKSLLVNYRVVGEKRKTNKRVSDHLVSCLKNTDILLSAWQEDPWCCWEQYN